MSGRNTCHRLSIDSDDVEDWSTYGNLTTSLITWKNVTTFAKKKKKAPMNQLVTNNIRIQILFYYFKNFLARWTDRQIAKYMFLDKLQRIL